MLEKYKIIFWDFDGVIMDSMPVRRMGFEKTLEKFPKDQVQELLVFHDQNGGLSRYVKFRYFFNEIRNEKITDKQVMELAASFSTIMLSLLIDENLLIKDSVEFIKQNWRKYEMHITSGSDGNELNKICNDLGLSQYFKSINGSPTPKIEIVKQLLQDHNYTKSDVVLIGDSKNDYDASIANDIDFVGYNSEDLLKLTDKYIFKFIGHE
jgi:phosphoglycolate phosphatase-like HAD superfamily hydrolase